MSNLAVNPETGDVVVWDGQKWSPAQLARNEQRGDTLAYDGQKWQFVTGTTKDGASTNDPATWEKWMQQDGRSTGEKVQRSVGLVGKGFNDAIGAGVAAPVEALNWGLKVPGRLVEWATGVNVPKVFPEGGFYTKKAQDALNVLGRNDTPENWVEKAAYGVGEGAGNAVSMAVPAAGVANLTRAGTTANGVARTLAAQPGMQAAMGAVGGGVGEATDNPWLGIAASMAVPVGAAVARGVISPGGVNPNAEHRRLVDVAMNQENIPLSAGQITGSRPLRAIESVFGTLPGTAGAQEVRAQAQREAVQRAALARTGTAGENLITPEVLNQTRERIGNELQDIAARNTMTLDVPRMRTVENLAREARRYLVDDQARPVLNRIDDLLNKIQNVTATTATVEGRAYANLDSALARHIRGTESGTARTALQDFRDALREAMDNSITGADAEAWQTARRQYANYKVLEGAMNRGSASTAVGNLSPAALSTEIAHGPQRNFAKGRGDMNDLARISRLFLQDPVGNSGTQERLMWQSLLSGAGGGLGGISGGVPGVLAGTAASIAGPRLAQAAYYSQPIQRYLTNQIAAGAFPNMNRGLLGAIGVGQTRPLLEY